MLARDDAAEVERLRSTILDLLTTEREMRLGVVALMQALGICIARTTPTRIEESCARARIHIKDLADIELEEILKLARLNEAAQHDANRRAV